MMETSIHVPMWLLSNVGGFVGFGIFSLLLVKYRRQSLARRGERYEAKKTKNRQKEEAKRQEELREELQEKERKRLENEVIEANLNRILPKEWRRLYDVLNNEKKATKEFVLLAFDTFQRDVLDPMRSVTNHIPGPGVPVLEPVGLEAILHVSYYNLAGEGNCHKTAMALFKKFVKFPEARSEANY